jgi:hypothetical protein
VPNFVNRPVLTLSGIKAVGTVDAIRIGTSRILIGMDDPGGDNHHDRLSTTYLESPSPAKSRRIMPRVPEKQVEHPIKKDKEVRLFSMLVRTPRNAGMGQGEIAHLGMKLVGQLIVAKKFSQPTTRIGEFL